MYGTGFLPTDEVNLYGVERDELYLTGTSEVALAAMHAEEVLDADASTPVRGLLDLLPPRGGRPEGHPRDVPRPQFDKVEMFVFTHPERSGEAHDFLLATEEELVAELGSPYRVVNIAAGDLGASASKKYDIEAWFPVRAATARSPRPRTRPTTSRAASRSASAPRRASSSFTRSTAPRSPRAR